MEKIFQLGVLSVLSFLLCVTLASDPVLCMSANIQGVLKVPVGGSHGMYVSPSGAFVYLPDTSGYLVSDAQIVYKTDLNFNTMSQWSVSQPWKNNPLMGLYIPSRFKMNFIFFGPMGPLRFPYPLQC